ncbi:hypothetical protein BGZ96_008634 [Linnemannia gamsii]|uniref:NodB homology domain-containing protein n=1 Tax=Linnemannia gamsii TaxID=64522 RepID=A0ABQ7JZX6_9FUNG|nr:hypothetical protein BGZ96_008634 [Linnemannia gamsii]
MSPFFRLASIAAALLSVTMIAQNHASAIPARVLTPQSSTPELAKMNKDADVHLQYIDKREYGVITSCTVPDTVALTFDDGPYKFTHELLDHLKDAGVMATFFINGKNIGDIYLYEGVVKRAYQEGHQIASHTWGHADLATLSYNEIHDQMSRLDDAIQSIIGVKPLYMRPPYGSLNHVSQNYLNDHGYKIVKWKIDTNDWAHPHDVGASVSEYRHSGGSGFIALQHDTIESTAKYLAPRAIEYVKQNGWRLVTVGECLGVPMANWYR